MSNNKLPEGFVYLEDPRFILSMNYATLDNFIGRPIQGYFAKVCIMTRQAHDALILVQNSLDSLNKGYRLRILDAYRPKTAVLDFKKWSLDLNDSRMKNQYYPNMQKSELFEKGYISENSAHCRGSTIDLTITEPSKISQPSNKNSAEYVDLDMGTIMDFFGEESHTQNTTISQEAKNNRQLLVTVMKAQGFINYHKEWWHYTLENEPFTEGTSFDFPVK